MKLELTDPTLGESEPGRCWTRTNISEAVPEVMSPFCWTFWASADAAATRRAWADFGLIPSSQVDVGADPNRMITGCVHGRQAINVDEVRQIVARAPGGSADDFERDILGYVRPDAPKVKSTYRQYPSMAVKFPAAIVRQRRRIRALHDEQLAWWRRDVLGEAPHAYGQQLLTEATGRFHRAIRLHLYSRNNLLPAVQGPLTALASAVGGRELANRVLGGLGDVREAEIADDLWLVSRGRLTVDAFLRNHGFHGPAEGNPIATVWREDPQVIKTAVAAKALPGGDMGASCTPGFYNNEGRTDEGIPIFATHYGGGPLDYIELLARWRAESIEHDLHVHREEADA